MDHADTKGLGWVELWTKVKDKICYESCDQLKSGFRVVTDELALSE